jgi:hypothetical protein
VANALRRRHPAASLPVLGAGLVLALGAGVVALTTNGAALRLVGGVVFVVVVGYCVTSLLGLSSGDAVQTVALTLGLGLATLIVGGLALDIFEGLDRAGWLGFVALIVGVSMLVLSRRRVSPLWRQRVAREYLERDVTPTEQRAPTPWALIAVTGVACIVAVSVALAIAVRSAHEQTGAGFTSLAFELPTTEDPGLSIVIENRERVPSTYRIDARAGDAVLLSIDHVELAADARTRYELPIDSVPSGTVVEVTLYRDEGTSPYRSISMAIP